MDPDETEWYSYAFEKNHCKFREDGFWQRQRLDDLLGMKMNCPACGYQWEPKDIQKIPKSCPKCKQYIEHRRQPWPAGYEFVTKHDFLWDIYYSDMSREPIVKYIRVL